MKIMKLLIMQFFQDFCHIFSVRSKYCICFSLRVRDQISYPCEITGKIIVLYVLLFR